jgi:FAD-dependent urate hydroxylase
MNGLRVLVVGAGVSGISLARGLLRDRHDVTVFEQCPDIKAAGGAVTIWPNGAMVLRQLDVDMRGAGQRLRSVRILTSRGHRLTSFDVADMADDFGEPVRMVPRATLLERLLGGFPAERIRRTSRVIGVFSTDSGIRVEREDGSSVEGDLLVGADGLHSVVRRVAGAKCAEPTGWCSWQGLLSIPGVADKEVAQILVGPRGSLGLWPAGGSHLQWWFDLPWSPDFVRPERPIDLIRAEFTGWSDAGDRVLATLTETDLARSPFPHYRHAVPSAACTGALTLLGDAAHTMPPTLSQGTNQALLDTMVLCKALSDFGQGIKRGDGDLSSALRWYENSRRRNVKAVSALASMQVSHSAVVLRPAALIPDRVMNWAWKQFLRSTSHYSMAVDIGRDLERAKATGSSCAGSIPAGSRGRDGSRDRQ